MLKRGNNILVTIIRLWIITGSLDAIAAIVLSLHTPPGKIFRYIASGVFGEDAFTAGADMIFWGIFFHYVIAMLFTSFLFLSYRQFKKLFANKYLIALIYGLFIWLIMNIVVLPLSYVPKFPFQTFSVLTGIIALVICIGLPTSIAASNYFKRRH